MRVTLDLGSAPKRVAASELELDRIVLNLTDNARKAMQGYGSLRVRLLDSVVQADSSIRFVTDDREGESSDALGMGDDEIRTLCSATASSRRQAVSEPLRPRAGHYTALVVSDDGCGMASDLRERIFAPLEEREEADDRRSEPGASAAGDDGAERGGSRGLGLENVTEIVRRRAGGMRVWSEAGRGTSVCVLLPQPSAEAAKSEAPNAGGTRPPSGSRGARPRAATHPRPTAAAELVRFEPPGSAPLPIEATFGVAFPTPPAEILRREGSGLQRPRSCEGAERELDVRHGPPGQRLLRLAR